MPDEPDPPRKFYDFKEREFVRDNELGATPMPTAKELAQMAGNYHNPKPREYGAKVSDPNDVYQVLEQNRRFEQKHNLDAIEIRKIRTRKWRDYLILIIPVELLLGTVTVLGRGNPVLFVSGLAGMVMIFTIVTWIMWQIMDRY